MNDYIGQDNGRPNPNPSMMPTRTFTALAMACLMTLMLALGSGCWGVTGRPAGLTPSQTLNYALEAHHRGDDRAFRALLLRIVDQNPQSPEATIARALLMSLPRTREATTPAAAPSQ